MTLVTAARPVLPVDPGHVAEARRALAWQAADVDDATALSLLWRARALPLALDVLADARRQAPLSRATIAGVTVVQSEDTAIRQVVAGAAPRADRALVAVAFADDELDADVHVDIVDAAALSAADAEPAVPLLTLRFSTVSIPRDDAPAVVRFQAP